MAGQQKYYQLTEGDRRIFAAAAQRKDPSIITNYYLRTETSGTYWRPVLKEDADALRLPEARAAAQRWIDGYEVLYENWVILGRPAYFGPDLLRPEKSIVVSESQYMQRRETDTLVYRVQMEDGLPVFHHPHGIRLLPWHYKMYSNRSGVQLALGGYGAAKTLGKLFLMLVKMVTLRNYTGLLLGPYSVQVEEMHKLVLQYIEGTEFEKRFFIHSATRPKPMIRCGHSDVGTTELIGYPILDNSGKLLSITADEAIIDQIEKFDDIDGVIRDVGSRFRGQIAGRPRVGQMTLTANTADHPVMWDWYDEGQEPNNRRVWSISPATFDNYYLTMADLLRYQDQVGKDEASQRMYLLGGRPTGSGEHFPAKSLDLCRDYDYDERITREIDNKTPGWEIRTAPRCDTYFFESPPNDDDTYLLVADPGWANPPERNSACIAVWKITGFPMVPATMVAFHWVFGENSPIPWLNQYHAWNEKYRTLGFNGFDSTGFQTGYEKMTDITQTQPTPVILNSTTKYRYLNLYKRWMAEGRFRVPSRFTYFFAQHAKYKLPDDKLRQDIVSMGLVTAALLEPFGYVNTTPAYKDKHFNPDDRYSPILEPGNHEDRY